MKGTMDTENSLPQPRPARTLPSGMDAHISECTPATVYQLIELLVNRMMVESLPEMTGLLAVTGRMTDPGPAKGQYHYNAKLGDDGGAQIKMRLPRALVTSIELRGGDRIRAVGRLQVSVSGFGPQILLDVGDIQRISVQGDASIRSDPGKMTLDALKQLPLVRRTFPERPLLTVSLVQSSSTLAQVNLDCRSEIENIEGLRIESIPINMLDPIAIATAIRSVEADILLLIRGGGDSADFEVFDDPRVVEAFVRCPSYRIAGLGHSGNATLVDVIADHSANTPGQAGVHIRETVEHQRRRNGQAEERLTTENKLRQAAEKDAEAAKAMLKLEQGRALEKGSATLKWAVVAFFLGMAIATMLRRLM